MREPIPVFGQGFFYVWHNGKIDQIIVFDYFDPDQYYYKVLNNKEMYLKEKTMLMNNMQYYLDQEKVLINGNRSFPRVKHVDIGLRGDPRYPFIIFFIEFGGVFVKGLNVYENIYEEEVVDYSYIVYWIFSEGLKAVEADVGVKYELASDAHILKFFVRKGTRVGGYERIVFELLD
ncbi:MAG: hypothetical protein J7K21_05060 [Desulfurococcales archaeon]|nr:hypothetical protein [Desulfurococcales archaeon]